MILIPRLGWKVEQREIVCEEGRLPLDVGEILKGCLERCREFSLFLRLFESWKVRNQ